MPTITALKKQKFSNRVNVYLDDQFGFGTDLETLVKSKIKVGLEISEEQLKEIQNTSDFQKTLSKLLNFATIRPRSYKEISNWFYKKKTPETHQKKLIKKLNSLELLDDNKFARWWLEQRATFRPKSKRELKFELLQKGINKLIISKVLEESEVDELSIAKNLIAKNSYKWSKFDDRKRKQKMCEYLARKGFSWEVVKKATAID